MRRIDHGSSLRKEAEYLYSSAERAAFMRKRSIVMSNKFNAESHTYKEVVGDAETGVKLSMTGKEARLMNAELERKFTKALRRYKGDGDRPRLTYYKLEESAAFKGKKLEVPKKLWEP